MAEEVFPNIYRLEIPLPGNPLKAINSYLIKDQGRYLQIDTGMNRVECQEAMTKYLQELRVDLKHVDFFITHLHADHLGLVSELAQEGAKIYFNHPDAQVINDPQHWAEMANTARRHGFPESDILAAISKHPGKRYHARRPLELTLLREGEKITIGDYAFICIETPGHTPGHMCLYEPHKKIFFSGDHLLNDITPNISLWSEEDDPLAKYLQSLEKIAAYEIGLVLPGHRGPFTNHRQRIAELKKHHEVRAAEVITILEKGEQTAYQVASQMTWDIDCARWEDFPLPQQWFAGGEALAHLQYLQGIGKVKRRMAGEIALFSLT
ncbi:MAG: MBL fold metallo-hydrolase [bacterium]